VLAAMSLQALQPRGRSCTHLLLSLSLWSEKNVPGMTMRGLGRASLLPGEPGDVFYKTAITQACSGQEVMGTPDPGSQR
jgi:hypothetical protein